jgi:hypothetical protein
MNYVILSALWMILKHCSGIHPSKSQLNEWARAANSNIPEGAKLEYITR